MLEEIPDLKVYFDVNIYFFRLEEHDHVTTLYAATSTFKEDLLLNAWQNNLMSITNKATFCSKYVSSTCSQMFDRINNLKRHVVACGEGNTVFIFTGGYYCSELFTLL